MKKFAEYLAAYDGSTDWSSVAPLFDGVFHDECVVVTANGELDKAQWREMAQGLRSKGAQISNFEITNTDGDRFSYRLTIKFPDGDHVHLAATATVEDDQLIRIEPADPSEYSELAKKA